MGLSLASTNSNTRINNTNVGRTLLGPPISSAVTRESATESNTTGDTGNDNNGDRGAHVASEIMLAAFAAATAGRSLPLATGESPAIRGHTRNAVTAAELESGTSFSIQRPSGEVQRAGARDDAQEATLEETSDVHQQEQQVTDVEGVSDAVRREVERAAASEEMCAITMTPLREIEHVTVLSCGHGFDREAIRRHFTFRQRPRCPTCRTRVDPYDHFDRVTFNLYLANSLRERLHERGYNDLYNRTLTQLWRMIGDEEEEEQSNDFIVLDRGYREMQMHGDEDFEPGDESDDDDASEQDEDGDQEGDQEDTDESASRLTDSDATSNSSSNSRSGSGSTIHARNRARRIFDDDGADLHTRRRGESYQEFSVSNENGITGIRVGPSDFCPVVYGGDGAGSNDQSSIGNTIFTSDDDNDADINSTTGSRNRHHDANTFDYSDFAPSPVFRFTPPSPARPPLMNNGVNHTGERETGSVSGQSAPSSQTTTTISTGNNATPSSANISNSTNQMPPIHPSLPRIFVTPSLPSLPPDQFDGPTPLATRFSNWAPPPIPPVPFVSQQQENRAYAHTPQGQGQQQQQQQQQAPTSLPYSRQQQQQQEAPTQTNHQTPEAYLHFQSQQHDQQQRQQHRNQQQNQTHHQPQQNQQHQPHQHQHQQYQQYFHNGQWPSYGPTGQQRAHTSQAENTGAQGPCYIVVHGTVNVNFISNTNSGRGPYDLRQGLATCGIFAPERAVRVGAVRRQRARHATAEITTRTRNHPPSSARHTVLP